MIYYTIYKVTNQINGKYYIGSHKTKNLNDNYMGSGKYLHRAFQKYGIENFTKEILFVFNTAKEMYQKESEIVNEDFLLEENTYNLKKGGFGGFDYINENKLYGFSNKETAKKARRQVDLILEEKYGKHWKKHLSNLAKESLQKILDKDPSYLKKRQRNTSGNNNPMFGKTHTEQTKKSISNANKGNKNPMFGKKWIHSLDYKCSKRINKNDPVPIGWLEGRKIKF